MKEDIRLNRMTFEIMYYFLALNKCSEEQYTQRENCHNGRMNVGIKQSVKITSRLKLV